MKNKLGLRRYRTSLASVLLMIILALYAIFQWGVSEPEVAPATPEIPSTTSLQAYFSQPDSITASSLRGGPDADLAAAIDDAQESVDVAVYRLDLWSIRDALLQAHRRGLEVRVVTEDENTSEDEILALQSAGVPVVDDGRPHLMHHKFLVIDGQEVWTGSMNLTVNGAYRNDNNLVRIASSTIAERFTDEFEDMFLEDRFGALSKANLPQGWVPLDTASIAVFFSPEDGILREILDHVYAAKQEVVLMAYAFTSDPLAQALLEQSRAGVEVRGVVEASQVDAAGADTLELRQAGLDLRLDNNPASMHHKVLILDSETVIFGSYNFTRSAEEANDEALLIVRDARLAQAFLIEFERIYRLATP